MLRFVNKLGNKPWGLSEKREWFVIKIMATSINVHKWCTCNVDAKFNDEYYIFQYNVQKRLVCLSTIRLTCRSRNIIYESRKQYSIGWTFSSVSIIQIFSFVCTINLKCKKMNTNTLNLYSLLNWVLVLVYDCKSDWKYGANQHKIIKLTRGSHHLWFLNTRSPQNIWAWKL